MCCVSYFGQYGHPGPVANLGSNSDCFGKIYL